MKDLLNVSSSPHVRSKDTTAMIMYDVALALFPALVFGVYRFGFYALLVVVISAGTAVAAEYAFQAATGQRITVSDGSALVTGLLLGLNLPPEVPLWIPVMGSVFAVIFVKQLFGGLGQNFMNPALGARCFLLISFAGLMSNYPVDSVSGATPLALLRAGKEVSVRAMFMGNIPGCIGEVSTFAILLGGGYLVIKKIIPIWIPTAYLGTFVIVIFLFSERGRDIFYLAAQLCGGGLMMGAFFMATDYVTSPVTKKGQMMFGVLLGILTGVFRLSGSSTEGVSYAIILGNLTVPLIERISIPAAFGREKKRIQGENRLKIKKDAAVLCSITLIAGLILGGIYQITKIPIEKQRKETVVRTCQAVCPEGKTFEAGEQLSRALSEAASLFENGEFGSVVINQALEAKDKMGNPAGYVISVTSKDGFSGEITLMVGFSPSEPVLITGMEIVQLNETAGMGMRADEEEFKVQYKGKPASKLFLTKQLASAENEIDAISGATITSSAVNNAVNAAIYFLHTYIKAGT